MKKRYVTLFLTFIILTVLFSLSYSYGYNTKPSICIDPGHGGFDGGATVNNTLEKDITLKASFIIGRLLINTGYNVIYTRYSDQALAMNKKTDMHKRLQIINDNNLLYISVHANLYSSSIVKGAQVFYNGNDNSSKELAEFIQEYLKEEDKTNNRFAKAIKDKFITDNAKIPGCIVELGFISNNEDLKILSTPSLLEKRCLMVYMGILKYLEYNLGESYERNKI